MLNQTFTVLFESLFINELGQAGEGKVWFKTKPIEEWIAENTPPISEQPISFMDFEPNTTVFPVVITGIVVLPNGQVTVVTPNGTFLADTTLIPRPVLKPTVLEDKNGNQFIVHPDGTVTALGQAGFIPKPMTTEEKLDKIRRGLYLEALKDYKTQIETYYTANNIAIPTRGPRNHNKNIIIDLPECIGTEANEIKDNFLAIKDNVNKKELRNSNLNLTLRTSKKLTYDALAQIVLTNLSARVKITETEFSKFLSGSELKKQIDTTCGTWAGFPKEGYVIFTGLSATDLARFRLIPNDADINGNFNLITPNKNGEWSNIDGFYWSGTSKKSEYWFKISASCHVEITEVSSGILNFATSINYLFEFAAKMRDKDFGVDWRPEFYGTSASQQHGAFFKSQSRNPFRK